MRKQFFYAALAIVMMSSCSKDNDPGATSNPNPDESSAKVALELGINVPNVSVSTRATGTVGGTTDETNLWNGQKLYIVAYDKGTTTPTIDTETDAYIFDGLTFQAPTQTWTPGANGAPGSVDGGKKILILKNETTVQAVYYNPTGNMDFYGYHIDDIGEGNLDNATKTVTGITITGAEDLLGAKTKVVDATNYPTPVATEDITAFNAESPVRGFSAWAARRNIQPILDFKHLLTRFTFNVTAAKASAAEWYWDGDSFEQNMSQETIPSSTAVKVKRITAKDIKSGMQIVLDGTDDTKTYPYAESVAASATTDLSLKSRDADGVMQTLEATAPTVYDEGEAGKNSWNNLDVEYSIKTPVGESLMLPAGGTSIQLVIELEQKVINTTELDGTPIDYKTKTGTVTTTLNYDDVKNSAQQGLTAFTAGYSYNVSIKVYSFEAIDITAELTKWAAGGDLDVDAE